MTTMLARTILLAGLLGAGTALAQGTASGNFITDQAIGHYRVSKFVGMDVFGPDNQRVGDINDIMVDAAGAPQAAVIGVGGFLGIGEKNVAVPFRSLTWSNARPVAATGTLGATMNPGPAATPGLNATNPNAGTTARRSPDETAAFDGRPDHATVALTKSDLQNAPGFRYYAETHASPVPTTPALPGMTAPTAAPITAPVTRP